VALTRIPHPSIGVPHVRCHGHTSQDLSLSSRILTTDDSVAQLHGDRDEIKGRTGAGHCDARDSHGIQENEALISAPSVVELKGRYSPRDDLSLSIIPANEGLVPDEHQEDEALAIMDKAHICVSNVTGIAANGERNGVMRRHNGATLIED